MPGKKSAARVGYDQEEAYFYQHDQELIEKMHDKRKLEAINGQRPEGAKAESDPKNSGAQKKRAA